MNSLGRTTLLIAALTVVSVAQVPQSDISSVVAKGKVSGDRYDNTYFGIALTAPKARFEAPVFVSVDGRRARLANIVYDSPDGAKNYTFGVLADSLEHYPKGMSTAVYVRSVRHQLEKDGLVTHREEFPVTISGAQFTGAVLKVLEKPNFGYYRGIYSTFLKGYIVTFEVQARHEERLQQLLASALTIKTGGMKAKSR